MIWALAFRIQVGICSCVSVMYKRDMLVRGMVVSSRRQISSIRSHDMVAKAVCLCVLVWLWDFTEIRIVAKSIVGQARRVEDNQSRWDHGTVIWLPS